MQIRREKYVLTGYNSALIKMCYLSICSLPFTFDHKQTIIKTLAVYSKDDLPEIILGCM